MNIKEEALQRWRSGEYIEKLNAVPLWDCRDNQWVPYEEYMKALLIEATPGEIGFLIVDFPPNSNEDNRLHIHPNSDRMITVVAGSGQFIAIRNKRIERSSINFGDTIWMPRGVLHTFLAGEHGLTVQSIHNPFIAFDDPNCLVYPRKEVYKI